MKLLQSFLALFLLVALVVPASLFAQGFSAGGVEPLTVTLNPQYPRPFDTVTITPRSNLIDLAAARVVVSVNGEIIEDGSGSRSVQTRVGAAGTRSVIRVTATEASGQVYAKEMVVTPADVALIIDAASTAHPFYEGARLVAPEGRVRVIAIPDLRTSAGATIPPQSLVYTWKNGDRVLLEHSGIGRSVLDATAPVRHRDAKITVTVSTQDKAVSASAVTTVSPVDPFVRVYTSSPLLGPSFENALSQSVTMEGDEDTFRAVPYFFRTTPEMAWSVNGVAGEKDDTLTVRITEPGRGTARIEVSALGGGVFQNAQAFFTLSFGSDGGTGIFGL
ncbi:hypothetical protein K2Y00_02790 [Patescibacteria group bacterium]|nr:hypothetical protein [Patescibacteria group bacterium]